MPTVLWSVQYEQHSGSAPITAPSDTNEHILNFPPTPMDPAFDDAVLDNVREVWKKIMGNEAGDFLVFEDREVVDEDD